MNSTCFISVSSPYNDLSLVSLLLSQSDCNCFIFFSISWLFLLIFLLVHFILIRFDHRFRTFMCINMELTQYFFFFKKFTAYLVIIFLKLLWFLIVLVIFVIGLPIQWLLFCLKYQYKIEINILGSRMRLLLLISWFHHLFAVWSQVITWPPLASVFSSI